MTDHEMSHNHETSTTTSNPSTATILLCRKIASYIYSIFFFVFLRFVGLNLDDLRNLFVYGADPMVPSRLRQSTHSQQCIHSVVSLAQLFYTLTGFSIMWSFQIIWSIPLNLLTHQPNNREQSICYIETSHEGVVTKHSFLSGFTSRPEHPKTIYLVDRFLFLNTSIIIWSTCTSKLLNSH